MQVQILKKQTQMETKSTRSIQLTFGDLEAN